MELRPYQEQTVNQIVSDWKRHDAVLATLATGAGKTIVFLELLTQLLAKNPMSRALILAHREELIYQPVERIKQFWPDWADRIGVVMADQNVCHLPITVGTVQTLTKKNRLQELLFFGQIDYLVTDECHHATADSYVALYKALRAVNPKMKHVGFTATPKRSDRVGLRNVFEHESVRFGIKEMVQQRWLVPPRWLGIETGISLKGVRKTAGDYAAKSLSKVYETSNCFDLVVATHKKYAGDRPSLAFTSTVQGAYDLAEKFREAGITATALDGTSDKDVRQQALSDLVTGKVQVLTNCALLTEGVDLPPASCVHQIRPTKSDLLYLQITGRILRPFPAKEDALILDYIPAENREIVLLGDVLGVKVDKKVYLEERNQGGVSGGFTFDGEVHWMIGDPTEIITRQLNYLSASTYSWYAEDGHMSVSLGECKMSDGRVADASLYLMPTQPNSPEMKLLKVLRFSIKRNAVVPGFTRNCTEVVQLGTGNFVELAERADLLIQNVSSGVFSEKMRVWRSTEPTEAQLGFAKSLGIDVRKINTRGQAAQAITHALAKRAVFFNS